MRTKECTFGASMDPERPERLRKALRSWVDQFTGDRSFEDVSSKDLEAKAASYDLVVGNIDQLESRLQVVLSELANMEAQK